MYIYNRQSLFTTANTATGRFYEATSCAGSRREAILLVYMCASVHSFTQVYIVFERVESVIYIDMPGDRETRAARLSRGLQQDFE